MKRILIIFLGGLILSGTAFGFADVTEIGVSAKPLGMGKACLGLQGDASSILFNPAAVSRITTLKVTSMSGTLLSEIGLLSLGVAYPTPYGTVGGAYTSSSLSGINLTRIVGGTVEVIGQTDYSNYALVMTYASGLDRFEFLHGFLPINYLSAGANLKLFNQGFSNQSGSMEGAQGSGMDIDLALQYDLTDDITLGVSLLNALPMSMGGKFTWQKNNVEEGIPALFKVGGAVRVEDWAKIMIDLDMWPVQRLPSAWHLGVEHTPLPAITLRMGIDQMASAVKVDNNVTLGIGFNYASFTFDYAYHQYGDLSENTTQFFSIGYLGVEKPKVRKKTREEVEAEIKKKVKPAPPLKYFYDIKEGFWAYKPIVYLASLNIFSGYPDGNFKPYKPLTRAELTALLVRAKEGKMSRSQRIAAARKIKFRDVKSTNWAAPYIAKAVELKYVSGYPDGKFQPNKALTLAEAVKVFVVFDGLEVPIALYDRPMPGISSRHWAARYVKAAKEAGFLDYLGPKPFQAGKKFTRAEAAYMLSRTAFGKEKIKEAFGETL